MGYTNSPMVAYTKLSPNHSGQRKHSIDRITPHCVVGQCSVETLGNIFYPTSRQASCQYSIGADGRVGMYVEEKNRSWCASSNENDQRAITIECASDTTHPYAFKDIVYQTLIKLCVDICKRNGKNKLLWMIGEVGEVIDIVKKHGPEASDADNPEREHLIEELADVLMYYNDVLLCYGITAEELKDTYTNKFQKNMKRW